MSENETKVVNLLEQILKWTKIGAMQLKSALLENLQDNEAKSVYEYSDGKRSSREVSKLVGISHTKVQRYWAKWAELGIVEQVDKYGGGRFKRLSSLRELGISAPQPKSIKKIKPLGEGDKNI